MRVAVISDIHGNLHALEAVLVELEREQPDEIWCLGDLVGYGPQPNRCCEEVATRAELCLAGNHDLGVLGSIDLEDFSHDAARSARWTRGQLDDGVRSWLEGLRPEGERDGAELFHASARDPVWEYILSGEAAADTLELTSAPVVLVGHSHVALAIGLRGGRLSGGIARAGKEVELDGSRWLLNPGSVGQPRDGDHRAAYLTVDLETGEAGWRRVDYDVRAAQQAIRDAGLPLRLGARLAEGR
jgi:diadenosine tetraphosphatase ApaH/serine/threonine PP2A family protein phosphatase